MVGTQLGGAVHVFRMRGDTGAVAGGEPVLDGSGMLLGIARRRIAEDNLVEILSVESIRRFRDDRSDGSIDGPPYVELGTWPLDDEPGLRAYLDMAYRETGVYITSVPSSSVFSGVLREGDVLLKIGGSNVDNQGRVETERYGRLPLTFLVGLERERRRLELQVLRSGVRLSLPLHVKPGCGERFLVPPRLPASRPRYLIWGGLLFQELTGEYLESWGDEWWKHTDTRLNHISHEHFDEPTEDRRRVVILNRVLPATVNIGYHDEAQLILETVDGRPVRDLSDLNRMLRGSSERLTDRYRDRSSDCSRNGLRDRFVELRFAGGRRIVPDRRQAEEILRRS